MKRFISGLLTLALVLSSVVSTAHEGMWLPMLIKRLNMAEMQANGLNLTAEELYDINNASVKKFDIISLLDKLSLEMQRSLLLALLLLLLPQRVEVLATVK